MEEYLEKMTDEYREGYEAGKQQGFMEGFHAGIKRVKELLEGANADGKSGKNNIAERAE